MMKQTGEFLEEGNSWQREMNMEMRRGQNSMPGMLWEQLGAWCGDGMNCVGADQAPSFIWNKRGATGGIWAGVM